MLKRSFAFLRDARAQTLSESALIYVLIVMLGFVPFAILGAAVLGFWDDFSELFAALTQ